MLDVAYIVNYGGEGMPQAALTNDKDDYQISNELIGHLIQGTKMLNYDDIMGPLSRKTLVKFQTDVNPSGRRLGGNEIVTVENPYLVLCGTGKNVMVGDDMPRRTLEIVLYSELEQPDLRPMKFTYFKPHIQKNRTRILGALMYMVQQ
jgi:hypothetical protein